PAIGEHFFGQEFSVGLGRDRWNLELVKVLKSPDVVEALNSHGLPPLPGTREDLSRDIARESATWGRVIRERKIAMP
ncbi:MAG: hypothetical protein EBV21_11345, partial [Betaproteobacteria bacterium]|nr:hypothetical protein [Betaproteobacteria bacterium]